MKCFMCINLVFLVRLLSNRRPTKASPSLTENNETKTAELSNKEVTQSWYWCVADPSVLHQGHGRLMGLAHVNPFSPPQFSLQHCGSKVLSFHDLTDSLSFIWCSEFWWCLNMNPSICWNFKIYPPFNTWVLDEHIFWLLTANITLLHLL